MVKHSDLLICDSVNIEKYIKSEYERYSPKTAYISYGSDVVPSKLSDSDSRFVDWMNKNGLKPNEYYMCCGRFVPENSFEIMIREFMNSSAKKDFAIITNENDKFKKELEKKLGFSTDPRIKFVGTVYEPELLKKIRENAFANMHGHTVGGTNPSLLEALGSTDVNLLINVSFNNEVAGDAALYWTAENGSLASLINQTELMTVEERTALGEKAKARVKNMYSWEFIGKQYEEIWKLN